MQHLERSPVLSHTGPQPSVFFSCACHLHTEISTSCDRRSVKTLRRPRNTLASTFAVHHAYQIDEAPHQKVSGTQHGATRLAMPSRKSEACEEPLNISGHRIQKPQPVVIWPLTRWFNAKDWETKLLGLPKTEEVPLTDPSPAFHYLSDHR